MSDTEYRIETDAITPTAEDLIVDEWLQLDSRLAQLRSRKVDIADEIRELVALRREKAKLVRIIRPALLAKPDANGDE